MKLFILLLIVVCQSQLCSDYYQDEIGCIQSIGISCLWNSLSNKCLESTGTKLGCLKVLNLKACVAQTQYPDKRIAACIFSGYCRTVQYDANDCASNLSRAACLGVRAVYCKWGTNGCERISDISTITSSSTLTGEMKLSSVGVCSYISGFPAIHQQGAHNALKDLYISNLMGSGVMSVYEQQLSTSGCFQPDEEVYKYINCNAEGLNAAACIKVANGLCKFDGTSCQTVTDTSILKCSDNLNQNACLAVTNISETCYWNGSQCTTYIIKTTTACQVGIQVSPSVCANITKEECFYLSIEKTCSGLCRSQTNFEKSSACLASIYGCQYDVMQGCTFSNGQQCDRLGQNKLACLNAEQYCRFTNGFCYSITNLNLLGCSSGLNKKACINLTNPSQVCQFTTECKSIYITPEDQCNYLYNVNANACSKVTTAGCYWAAGYCNITLGNEQCIVSGLNKIACLATTNTLLPCHWNGSSGSCESITVSRDDTCSSLKMVNAVACRNITYSVGGIFQLCKYNSLTYSCEVFTMSNAILCTTPGLNSIGCSSVQDPTLSCRWQGNQCVNIQSLGNAVTCQALQLVTARTCAMIQSGIQKCKYDTSRQSCTTSVPPTSSCSESGLNPAGCASLSSSCYFETTNNICKTAAAAEYSIIQCDSNWPSKTACINIATNEQYCKWNSTSNICELQVFPVSNSCNKYTNVNKLFCLAYEISVTRYISSSNYCTYDSSSHSCKLYTSAAWTDCGTTLDVNMHACVALSNPSKNCYFEQTTLKCTEITSPTDDKFKSLTCKVANQSTCLGIQTIQQYCQWQTNQNKCQPIKSGGDCTDYVSGSLTNPNLCSSTNDSYACSYDITNKLCKQETATNLGCTTSGLNIKACLENTNEPCYFDSVNFKCLLMDASASLNIKCSDKVNLKGCLFSKKEACYWDETNNVCKVVTGVDWNTVTCVHFQTIKYNALTCAQVTTSGEYCGYQDNQSQCTTYAGMYINNCEAGHNQASCEYSGFCKDWDSKTKICADKTSSVAGPCDGKASSADCLAVTTVTCGWVNGNCQQFDVTDDYPTCGQLSSAGGNHFSARLCQELQNSDSFCQYDNANQACKTVPTDTMDCDTVGMNRQACIYKTKGNTCLFNDDKTSSSYGCQGISDFTDQECSKLLNPLACASVTKTICLFNYVLNYCFEADKYWVNYFECKDFADKSYQIVTSNLCQYVKGNDGCVYDNTNKVCKIQNTQVPNCVNTPALNQGQCLNYVTSQTCDYYIEQGCFVYDTTNLPCSYCYTFKQCVNSANQSCSWDGSTCQYVYSWSDCLGLTNVNARACMSIDNGDQKCQFKDSGLSTSCIVPLNDTQPCYGLNKTACIANTANGCYFINQCNDIALNPYDAQCQWPNGFTYSGCMGIKTPGQLCYWYNNSCEPTSVDENEACSTYASNIYSGLICASILNGNCYWNNGCVSGVAPNCQTIGANKGACVGATSGNCIFSQKVCMDVSNTTSKIFNYCNDPSNRGGCLNLNNGLACGWNGTSCDYITVSAGCATYTNVNPGVCGQTTDVACKWVNNACQAMTVKGSCTDKGLNKIACIQLTNGYCYYDTTMNQCYSIDDIKSKDCTDNINKNACLDHPSKCCKWFNNACINGTSGNTCSALSINSNYCCISLTGDKCTYTTTCAKLINEYARCYEAANITACMWIQSSCRWDAKLMQCMAVPNNYGCKATINGTACSQQSIHCKYINGTCIAANVATDSCSDLEISSLSSTKCILIQNGKCQQGTSGCIVPTGNPDCTDNLNKIACLQNANPCNWNALTYKCSEVIINSTLPVCSTGTLISQGVCSSSSQNCYLSSDFTCHLINDIKSGTISCDQRNSVGSTQFSQCTSIPNSICQYDSMLEICTSTIFGITCEVTITEYGCAYIQNNCYWSNNSCKTYDSTLQFYKCESIFSKYQCLRNVSTACSWNSLDHKCITYIGDMQSCSKYTDAITSPGICYFYSTDFCAYNGSTCYLETSQTICTNSKSPLGCQANTQGNCYWDLYVGKCMALTDTSLAAGMTCPLFKYSNRQFCMAPTGEGQTCVWEDNLCQSANVQEVKCSSDLSINGCIAVALQGEQCIFNTKCDYSDNTITICTDALNIYACLAVLKDGQYCKWLGQMCYSLSQDYEDGYLVGTHLLVNANACRKTYTKNGAPAGGLASVGVKYDPINYVCQLSDIESDQCSTPGLNYYGCLTTKAAACDWNGSRCVFFNFNVSYTNCEDYKSVSPKVCASITTGKLKCQHNSTTLDCENFTEDQDIFIGDSHTNSKQGMNRLACINVKSQPTIWKNGQCYYNEVKQAVTTCGELVDVNARSCAQVDKDDIICKYDSDGKCTTLFDGTIDKCVTLGLNKLGCVLVENVQCQFNDGVCNYYDSNSFYDCSSTTNVNSLVCQKIPNYPCKFSYINRGCVDVFQEDRCSATGINKLGCSKQTNCSWINDKCYCKALAQSQGLIDCSVFAVKQCIQSQCIVDNGSCRNLNCNDIVNEKCNSSYIGPVKCYLNKTICTAAQKCNDLFNVTCSSYSFNGITCVSDPWNLNHCVNKSCSAYTTQDQCSGDCTWSSSSGCTIKECQYMKKELCTGIMNNKQCYWDGQYCQSLNTCQEFIQYQTNQTEAICEAQTILNKQCYWKKTKPYGNDYQCTSSICYDKGNSKVSCHGTEVQNEVCILLPDYSCISCSEITDPCSCIEQSYCYYIEGKGCQSNPCSNENKDSCETNSDRCVYSNGSCKQVCGKLSETECNARESSSECHWNSDSSKCLIGLKPTITINSLADVITIESSYSRILVILIVELLF